MKLYLVKEDERLVWVAALAHERRGWPGGVGVAVEYLDAQVPGVVAFADDGEVGAGRVNYS